MELSFEDLMKYEQGKHRIKQLKLQTFVTANGISVVNKRQETIIHKASVSQYVAFCKGIIFVLEHKKNNITNDVKSLVKAGK